MKEIKEPTHWISDNPERTSLAINFWFQREVEPHNKLIREALKVWSYDGAEGESVWCEKHQCGPVTRKYQAYLIGIEPIVKETKFHNPALQELRDKIMKSMDEFDKLFEQESC